MHTCSNKGHWSKCCMVWGSDQQSQVRSWLSFKYLHLWRSALQRPVPVFSLLRHFHSVHIRSAPAGSSSQGLSAIGETGERSESRSFHKATLILSEVDVGRGSTLFRKLSLNANRCSCMVEERMLSFFNLMFAFSDAGNTPSNIRCLDV